MRHIKFKAVLGLIPGLMLHCSQNIYAQQSPRPGRSILNSTFSGGIQSGTTASDNTLREMIHKSAIRPVGGQRFRAPKLPVRTPDGIWSAVGSSSKGNQTHESSSAESYSSGHGQTENSSRSISNTESHSQSAAQTAAAQQAAAQAAAAQRAAAAEAAANAARATQNAISNSIRGF